jgi:hypothetical protein
MYRHELNQEKEGDWTAVRRPGRKHKILGQAFLPTVPGSPENVPPFRTQTANNPNTRFETCTVLLPRDGTLMLHVP